MGPMKTKFQSTLSFGKKDLPSNVVDSAATRSGYVAESSPTPANVVDMLQQHAVVTIDASPTKRPTQSSFYPQPKRRWGKKTD